MLLTIKQPTHYKKFHEYTPPTPPSTARFSPALGSTGLTFPPIPASQTSSSSIVTSKPMSTHHRGLPPPAAMIPQPQPQTQPPPIGQPPLNQPMGQLPAPPQQWQGAEESMRNWLLAKAEEDKRKQEEEKTRQEALRLEQRKVEHTMLQTSLEGGIPPYMIPMVFAGMGGGNLPNASLEWAQQYMQQTHQLQQQQIQQQQQQQQLLPSSQRSPELIQRRDSRAVGQPYPGQQHPAPVTLPSTPIGATAPQGAFISGYPSSPGLRSRQAAQSQVPRPPQTSQLPRLNTGEMHIHPPPTGPSGMQVLPAQAVHPLQQSQTAQQAEPQSSPSIYFHHWQPPTSQAATSAANPPSTPSDHTSSPKKRKAPGPHQAAPPPTSQPQYTSPQFSQTGSSVSNTPQSRRRGHSRQTSDISTRGLDYGRPGSRHQHTESTFSTQGLTSPRELAEQGQTGPTEIRRRSGGSNPVSALLEQSDSRPQSLQQQQQQQQQARYSAGPEMRREERRTPPSGEDSRRGNAIKRDDGRD